MTCNCKKKYIGDATICYDGKTILTEKYQCIKSGKFVYYDKETKKQIDFGGRAGEELVSNG